jgi:hypothetical protein
MMKKSKTAIIFMVILTAGISTGQEPADQAVITTGSLFQEMIDLERLTYFPDPAYRIKQYSSFDRRSRIPQGPGWFANSDGFGGEPIPNFEQVIQPYSPGNPGRYLIADVNGPGAVVRTWSAAIAGRIEVYIDGALLYEGEAVDFFHRPYHQFSQIDNVNQPRLERTLYQRQSAYTPMPFKGNLRIIWIGNPEDIHFYHIEVRKYEENTAVQSFSPEDIDSYRDVIDRTTAVLDNPDAEFPQPADNQTRPIQTGLFPGQGKDVLVLSRPLAVTELRLKVDAAEIGRALRQTLLHITFDDYPWPQVQAPLGDFFGAAPGINPYVSLPFSVHPDNTMVCRFVMPFKHRMVLRLENRGKQKVQIQGHAGYQDYAWDEQQSMHFRARWRVNHQLTASNQQVMDLPFLLAEGKGLYVGTASYLLNPNSVPTPYGNWWGEGDEKVFIDDDTLPSLFGTGSEDYYNYAWSSPDIFAYPFCGQPRNDGPGNRGFVTNFRWHILDPLPFLERIRFYMELFSHERTPGLSYARIGYHYARPGLTDDHIPLMPEDLRSQELALWQPAARMGARNSKFFPAESILADTANTHIRTGNLWAGGECIFWKPGNEDEQKSLAFTVADAGKKRIFLTLALTPLSGRIKVLLDGEEIQFTETKTEIDLHRPHRILLRNFALPETELSAGEHCLTLIYSGAEPEIESPEIGIDFIWVQSIHK